MHVFHSNTDPSFVDGTNACILGGWWCRPNFLSAYRLVPFPPLTLFEVDEVGLPPGELFGPFEVDVGGGLPITPAGGNAGGATGGCVGGGTSG